MQKNILAVSVTERWSEEDGPNCGRLSRRATTRVFRFFHFYTLNNSGGNFLLLMFLQVISLIVTKIQMLSWVYKLTKKNFISTVNSTYLVKWDFNKSHNFWMNFRFQTSELSLAINNKNIHFQKNLPAGWTGYHLFASK